MTALVHGFAHQIRGLEIRRKQILLVDWIYPDTLVFHRYLDLQVFIAAVEGLYSDEDHALQMRELHCV